MPYVYSTLSSSVLYVGYTKTDGNDLPVVDWKVLIKGGANVADAHIVTPHGVGTKVTDEQLALLESNELFKRHKENGFIRTSSGKKDPNSVADDMEAADDSAPITPEDFEESESGPKPAKAGKGKGMADKVAKMLGEDS